ncbi:MAG TPA: hypothetical protein PLO33_09375 [Kouleothrix sp.]|uniref:hypothetical protein n=1 Tax=Kouleothrix sp. TaxID=2779161 RepID=UPI002CEE7D10|nr:hypothetical protein [Kouleothrix sp.]HRC75880.1 hypothetical protein [Kouleothrix sp.]
MIELDRKWQHHARRLVFEDYRRRHVTAWIAPHGTSMRPLIGRDTWLQVEFGAASVAIGDIILFPLGDMLVAHRVVAMRQRHGQTIVVPKGDAEPFCDPRVPLDDVIGVVRALRAGRNGAVSSLGCSGAPARLIAQLSRQHGRAANGARRFAALLPNPLRRLAIGAIPPLARVVARVLFAPFPWAAWLRIPDLADGRR